MLVKTIQNVFSVNFEKPDFKGVRLGEALFSNDAFKMNTTTQKQTKLPIPISNVHCLKKSKRGNIILTSGGKIYAYTEGVYFYLK